MHHLTSVAVAVETALNRGDHAEALPHLLWMQQTLDSFGPARRSLPDSDDAALFLAQCHPDDARHDALAAEFRAALDADARPNLRHRRTGRDHAVPMPPDHRDRPAGPVRAEPARGGRTRASTSGRTGGSGRAQAHPAADGPASGSDHVGKTASGTSR